MNTNELNHEEYNRGEKKLESYPRTVFVELTRRCNMYCTCCRPEILGDRKLDMPDDILEMVEKELFPTAEVIDFRGWGESTLDERLLDLVSRWENKGKNLFIYTNCQARTPEYWEELYKHNLNIAISLRSAKKEVYEGFMRGASYEKLISHLERIPVDNKVLLTVVIDDENINELIGIVELASKYNIKTIHLNPLAQRPFPEDYPTFGVSENNREYLLETLNAIQEKSKEYQINIKVCADLLSDDQHELKRCIHPWSYVYISNTGEIGFCDHLMCVEEAIFGNIRDGFDKIWNCEKYQEVRNKHFHLDIDEVFCDHIECKWCYKNRYGNWESLLEPHNTPIDLNQYLQMKSEQ